MIQITPQIGGTVMAIMADDTDFVKAGQPLVQLDPADAKVALDQAEAALAQAVRQVRTLYANNGSLAAQVTLRQADIVKAQSDIARAQDDLQAPPGAVGQRRGVEGRAQPRRDRAGQRQERAGRGAGRRGRGARAAGQQPVADRRHQRRAAPERAGRRRQGARGLPRDAARRAAGAGRRLRGQAHRAARPARRRRHADDVDRAAQPAVGRRQLQGSAAAQHPHRPAGEAHRRRLRQEGRVHRHAWPAWASAPAPPSRCCRRRTPPATGSRWCSACRCASRSMPSSSRPIRCAWACRWTPRST